MTQKVKITDGEQYEALLKKFKAALEDRIPYAENCLVQFHRSPEVAMQYGPSAITCVLETESSGRDEYIIYMDNSGHATFIRSM